MASASQDVAKSWDGVRCISRPAPRGDWRVPIDAVLKQVHPGACLHEDGMLVMADMVDFLLHRLATQTEQLSSLRRSRVSGLPCNQEGEPVPHQVLAHRWLPRDEFLISFLDDEEPTWELREDALAAGIDLASFEASTPQEVEAAWQSFRKAFEARSGQPLDALALRHVQQAAMAVLPGELSKHALSEGKKAINKYKTSWITGFKIPAQALRATFTNPPVSRTACSGLVFPVDIIGGILACSCSRAPSDLAVVWLAAVLEYLVAEVLELAGNVTSQPDSDAAHVICARHITITILNDEELNTLFCRCMLMRGGFLPKIAQALILGTMRGDIEGEEPMPEEIHEVQFVTGKSFLMSEYVDDKSIVKSPEELAPVTTWTNQQLAEACIAKFRNPAPPPPSLPHGVTPLPSFVCPISLDLMRDPVLTADGMTFERLHIEKWLAQSNVSPKTGLELPNCELKPNHALRNAIEEWVSHEQEKRKRAPAAAADASHAASAKSELPAAEQGVERYLNELSDSGWRLIAARAGVLAMHTGLFTELRVLARDLLVALVHDAVSSCRLAGRQTVLLVDVLRAVLCSDPHGRTQKVKGQQVPLGSGFLGEALALSWRPPASASAGSIDWAQEAAAERTETKGDHKSKQSVLCVVEDAGDADAEGELEDLAAADKDDESPETDDTKGRKKVARKEAMRMIRTEQRCAYSTANGWPKAGEVFDFGTFSALIVEIGKNLQGEAAGGKLMWEASAFAMAYHVLEAYAVQILEDALLIAAHSSRVFLWPADMQLARRVRREIA